MWMNHWIKTRGTWPAWLGSACSLHHPLFLADWCGAWSPGWQGPAFTRTTYGSSAVYGETTYTCMYTDTVICAHIDNKLGINISFMLTFCPLCLGNRWKKTDVITNISQHTADSHQSGKAVLNIFHSAIQYSRDGFCQKELIHLTPSYWNQI